MPHKKFSARVKMGQMLTMLCLKKSQPTFPSFSCTDNQEILINEIVPQVQRLRTQFGWTWRTLWDRLGWCMDEDMSNLWATIMDTDYNANNARKENNLKPAIRALISKAINREFPRDDILKMMQTGMRKAADETPSQHYEQILQLKKCCEWTAGVGTVPGEAECKVLFIRQMPQNLKDCLSLCGLMQESDLNTLNRKP